MVFPVNRTVLTWSARPYQIRVRLLKRPPYHIRDIDLNALRFVLTLSVVNPIVILVRTIYLPAILARVPSTHQTHQTLRVSGSLTPAVLNPSPSTTCTIANHSGYSCTHAEQVSFIAVMFQRYRLTPMNAKLVGHSHMPLPPRPPISKCPREQ